jgi:hypothetical protein
MATVPGAGLMVPAHPAGAGAPVAAPKLATRTPEQLASPVIAARYPDGVAVIATDPGTF